VTLDVSVLVRPGMPIWTGNPGISLTQTSFLAHGETANVSKLCCGVHTGTHVDAPRHFIDGAGGVETLDVDALCGPALVVDFRHCGPVKLADADGAPARVLLRHSPAMWHDPLDQETTADPSAVSAAELPI
jgi:arylformamidase